MNEIKYIYFEIKYVKGVDETEPTIQNENDGSINALS